MRPHTINDIIGQDHLLSDKSSFLRSAIEANRLPSFILWGPPGTGKTSIGRAIVNSCSLSSSYRFVSLSAVTAGVKDVRDVVDEARRIKKTSINSMRTVLFVDEVHRFNKSQLDSFLPVIEDGSIVFIGATTENPSFHLITPLLSRFIGFMPARIQVCDEVVEYFVAACDGDARERRSLQRFCLGYEDGLSGGNVIFAIYTSSGISDYKNIGWQGMLEGGEQPLYIARRLIQFSSEDVGMADPLALPQAVSCYQACHFLEHYSLPRRLLKIQLGNEGVPLHLKKASTSLMNEYIDKLNQVIIDWRIWDVLEMTNLLYDNWHVKKYNADLNEK
ncbi:ATPase WRNIP1 [Tanacetum coccineum]